ncbi:MAG: ATP-binding protein [Pseudomonadota bacterium]
MFPHGLVLILGVLLGAGAALLFAKQRARGADRRAVESLGAPAAIATETGTLVACNTAMLDAAANAGLSRPDTLARLFRSVLGEIDAAQLYRLARTAETAGIAFQPVRLADAKASPRDVHLVVRPHCEGYTLWALQPSTRIAEMAAGQAASPYNALPVPHLRRLGTAQAAVVNDAFTALFGADPAPVLARLDTLSNHGGDRISLPTKDDTTGVFRCFPVPSDGLAEDFLIFPISAATAGCRGAAGVLETVPIPLVQFELNGALLWCNAPARDILADDAEPGRALAKIIEPIGRPVTQLLEDALSNHGPTHGEMVRLARNQAFVQVVLTRVRLYERETLLAVLNDASEMRRLEDQFAQSQKMEAVGKLAGGVAHDFNNVLTAIVGNCDLLLLRKDVSHPDYADLMQIAQNANRAAALVRQLLAFSRKQTLSPKTLPVQDVISEAQYLLDRLVGERIRLSTEYGSDLWDVRADHQQLEQVLMNLVVNARDAMDGSGTITISAYNCVHPVDQTGVTADFVEIAVHDSGPGIDPSVLDNVFDPFFTTKPKGEGTGLGLSTVYGIVRQSGGQILAENHPDGGAVFRMRLPRATAGAPVQIAAPPPRQSRDLTGSGSVLLVEDEAPVRAFAARALRLRGYEVAEAETAEEAMEILADPTFDVDLLVSDVVMPGMDGPTFATHARKLRPGLRLVFVSGYAEESFRKNLTDMDFLFLPKPFSLNDLTSKVKEALGDPVA